MSQEKEIHFANNINSATKKKLILLDLNLYKSLRIGPGIFLKKIEEWTIDGSQLMTTFETIEFLLLSKSLLK